MRFVVLRSKVDNDNNTLGVEILVSLTQKASGTVGLWMDLSQAKINYLVPEESNFLSFPEDEVDDLAQNLEIWHIANETVVIIGVSEPLPTQNLLDESAKSENT